MAFETVRHELVKLVDTETKKWAGQSYNDGKKTQVKFGDLPASHWIMHELADDGTGRAYNKFLIKNRLTQKVYKKKATALEAISGSSNSSKELGSCFDFHDVMFLSTSRLLSGMEMFRN